MLKGFRVTALKLGVGNLAFGLNEYVSDLDLKPPLSTEFFIIYVLLHQVYSFPVFKKLYNI